jgi:hypothetical protein
MVGILLDASVVIALMLVVGIVGLNRGSVEMMTVANR